MNDRDIKTLVQDAADAWRPVGERADASAPTPGVRNDADDAIPEHIRKDCAERAPGCRAVSDGQGGWKYAGTDGAGDRADAGVRVERRDV